MQFIFGIVILCIGLIASTIGTFMAKDGWEKLHNNEARKDTIPRLRIELRPGLRGSREYLWKDGNSQIYWHALHNNINLVTPFEIQNVGKVSVINITARYFSPSEPSGTPFQLGEAAALLASGEKIGARFRPWINISSIVGDDNEKEFSVKLELSYHSDDPNDRGVYKTTLEMVVIKESVDQQIRYLIKGDPKLIFGKE